MTVIVATINSNEEKISPKSYKHVRDDVPITAMQAVSLAVSEVFTKPGDTNSFFFFWHMLA